MIEQLLFVRCLELNGKEDEVALTHHFKHSLPGLFKRGLVDTKAVEVKGKTLMKIHITSKGLAIIRALLTDIDQGENGNSQQ